MDSNKHKFFLLQLLKDIYSDVELAPILGFKGGTAAMFFYGLPRFSVDLDFDLLNTEKVKSVYDKLRKIVLNYGEIHDEALKHYGTIVVLDYGFGERKLKLEVSNRQWGSRYEIKNYLGVSMQVMVVQDMFAHKLCALLDRTDIINRDIFDVWFFAQNRTPVNKKIVETRMKIPFTDYLQQCIQKLNSMSPQRILSGLGELMDDDLKKMVRAKLLPETISLLKFYQTFPILSE